MWGLNPSAEHLKLSSNPFEVHVSFNQTYNLPSVKSITLLNTQVNVEKYFDTKKDSI